MHDVDPDGPGTSGGTGRVTRILEVRHLELVEAIHRRGTLTAAARDLHMTQPAASHALAKLEDRLGARLFTREPDGMAITPEGRRVLDATGRVLGELERAEYDLRQLAGGVRGVLRLSTECFTAYHWVPEVIRQMQHDHPGIELRLQPDTTNRVLDALHAGELDLALMYRPPPDDAYVAVPIVDDELVAVVRADHPWNGRPHVEAEDFATETTMVHSDAEESILFQFVLRPAGVRPARVLELWLTEALVAAARAGLGVAVTTRRAVAPEIDGRTLAAVRITRGGLHRRWHAVVRRERARFPHVTRLIELLKEHAFATSPNPPGPGGRVRKRAGDAGKRGGRRQPPAADGER